MDLYNKYFLKQLFYSSSFEFAVVRVSQNATGAISSLVSMANPLFVIFRNVISLPLVLFHSMSGIFGVLHKKIMSHRFEMSILECYPVFAYETSMSMNAFFSLTPSSSSFASGTISGYM